MYIKRNFPIRSILNFSGGHLVYLTAYSILTVILYEVFGFTWMAIPWLPVSLVGTAVAFYVGFKNNSSYDRMWEARKIWGAIVNDSRSWGIGSKHFITDLFAGQPINESDLKEIRKTMLYRHIAWLYTLRRQLLKPTPWEHLNAGMHIGKLAKKRMKTYGLGLLKGDIHESNIEGLLSSDDLRNLDSAKNQATRLIDLQAEQLKELRAQGLIDDFRHMELQKLLNHFYTHQGKCERIKNYPLPRQYASTSMVFIAIFIFLLPLGMMAEFAKLGEHFVWLTIPFTAIAGWVYVMMELVGDYSENPFEGMGNDIPMYSLCRTIEIDLRQMLDETELPQKIDAVNNVLM
ncbi:MAG: bestrophin family ion channel [Bacteroidota bacterium]